MPPPRLTHFLCLPLVSQTSRSQLQQSLQSFAATATTTHDVPPKAIRPIGTIHLTLGVMQLATEEQVEAATAFLRSLDIVGMLKTAALPQPLPLAEATKPQNNPSIPVSLPGASSGEESVTSVVFSTLQACDPPSPLIISLSGLESMHAPKKTSNLYTVPKDPTSRLSSFAILVRDAFTTANLLVPDKRPLLLHATVLNTLYAKSKSRTRAIGHGKNKRGVEKLDATALLQDFQDFEWAKDFRIEKISICEMGAKKEIVDGNVVNEEYVEIATAQLP